MYRKYRQEMAKQKDNKKSLRCIMFLGSVREGRVVDRVATFMKQHLEARGFEVETFDPEELQFPLLKKAIVHYENPADVPDWMQKCVEKVTQADAYVVVSCEYNHSIPPALSNMLDHFGGLPQLFFKPSGIVCYSPGPFGGMRAAMQLRVFLAEIGCTSVHRIFSVPQIYQALDEKGSPLNDHMDRGARLLIDQLEWTAVAMKNHREAMGVPQLPPPGT